MLSAWIASFFELSRVRARSLVRAAFFFFLFVGGVTALKSATNALFLVRSNPTDLPYLYLATAVGEFLCKFRGGEFLLRQAKFFAPGTDGIAEAFANIRSGTPLPHCIDGRGV